MIADGKLQQIERIRHIDLAVAVDINGVAGNEHRVAAEIAKEADDIAQIHFAVAVRIAADMFILGKCIIAAAKAAESLLSIKGVDAAFALIRIGGETHISARSGAAVSVQLILEKMGGGGHLDSAGARSADPMVTVLEQLKAAIDAYIEENSAPTGTEI